MKRWFINRWTLLALLAIFIGVVFGHLVGSYPIYFLLLIFPVLFLIVELILIHFKKDNDWSWGIIRYIFYMAWTGGLILIWFRAGYIAALVYLLESYFLMKIAVKKANPPWINPAL